MVDAVDIKYVLFDVQSEQHPVVTSTSGAKTEKFIRQWLAKPVRIPGEGSGDKFNDCGSGFFR